MPLNIRRATVAIASAATLGLAAAALAAEQPILFDITWGAWVNEPFVDLTDRELAGVTALRDIVEQRDGPSSVCLAATPAALARIVRPPTECSRFTYRTTTRRLDDFTRFLASKYEAKYRGQTSGATITAHHNGNYYRVYRTSRSR